MRPDEKAKELVDKMHSANKYLNYDRAKTMALICVDEILSLGFIFWGSPNKHNDPAYWDNVKKEISLLQLTHYYDA